MNARTNQHVWQFVWAMRIFAFIYLVGALGFFFMPEETFYMINVGPKVFKAFEEIPMPSEHFWCVLATSMMAMLCMTSALSSMFPRVKGYVFIHLFSKAVSVAGFTYSFLRYKRYFAYAVGAATDSLVFLIVLGFFLMSQVDENPNKAVP